jgi:hypothetical protein
MAGYESPAVIELGSVAEFTQGQGLRGDADHIHINLGRWGSIDFSFGHS